MRGLVDIELDVTVCEMAADAASVVKLDPAKTKKLVEVYGDENPEFPVLKVQPGTSNNKRHWPAEILPSIAEQVNQSNPVGYLGHIKPEDDGFAFPAVQTVWLGAETRQEGGQQVLYVKGYNIPGAEIRDKQLVKSGIIRETSWRGKAATRTVNGVQHIEKFVLESIDWSRPGKAGMKAGVVAIASEMQEGSDNNVDWAKATLDDIQRENPSLFALMKQRVEGESATKVAEMEEKVQAAEEAETVFTQLRKVLKIDEAADIISAVTDVVSKVESIGAKEIRERVSDILKGKITDEKARKTVMRLLPVTEMESIEDDKLEAEVDKHLNDDEDIRAIVGEMVVTPPQVNHQGQSNQGNGRKVGASGMVTVSRKTL